jgi:hypothetical protein
MMKGQNQSAESFPEKFPSLRDIHQAAVPIPKAGTLFLIASVIYLAMP